MFDNVFGVHEQALRLRQQRTELLASNLANAETPHFKARDIDFRAAMTGALADQNTMGMARTHGAHIGSADGGASGLVQYRMPTQPSIDGNTVETHIEQTLFTDNALMYQTTLEFIDNRIQRIKGALRGD
ncbi:flagellar basal body rod protein FlgB [Thiomicrospira sp. ALE5]|uniref:flagellar basal body rod protein FlgB n=1 Tax=Thiomicrospira sp. ALE5 TaxID=748650 RepID=UPI0008EBF3F7|nr:flagellar basal body rod protein FlgB [Thiomicrospira sp. ALE5]SFR51047.1 flagellar basal-body rod protein FlgB [Thiomicrospira sp. ALE5]